MKRRTIFILISVMMLTLPVIPADNAQGLCIEDPGNDQDSLLNWTDMSYLSVGMMVLGGEVYGFINGTTVLQVSGDGEDWNPLNNFTQNQSVPWGSNLGLLCHDSRGYIYVSFRHDDKVYWSKDNGTSFSVLLNFYEEEGGSEHAACTLMGGLDYYQGSLWVGRYGYPVSDGDNNYSQIYELYGDNGTVKKHWDIKCYHIHAVRVGVDGKVYAAYGDPDNDPYAGGVATLNTTSDKFENVTNMALMKTYAGCILRTDTTTLFFPDNPKAPAAMLIDASGNWDYPITWDIRTNINARGTYVTDYVDGVLYAPLVGWTNPGSPPWGTGELYASPDDGHTWIKLRQFGLGGGPSCAAGEDGFPYIFLYNGTVSRINNIGQDEIRRLIYKPSTNDETPDYDESFYIGNNQTIQLPLNRETLKDVNVTLYGYNTTQLILNGGFIVWTDKSKDSPPDNWTWVQRNATKYHIYCGTDGIFGSDCVIINYTNYACEDTYLLQSSGSGKYVEPGSNLTLVVPAKGNSGNPHFVPLIWFRGINSTWSGTVYQYHYCPISPEIGEWNNYTFSVTVPTDCDAMRLGIEIYPHSVTGYSETGNFSIDGLKCFQQPTASGFMTGMHSSRYQSICTVNASVKFDGIWHNFTGTKTDGEYVGHWNLDDLGGIINITTANTAGPIKIRIQGSRIGISHAPIVINGDSGFNTTNGVVAGDGTSSNPYQIRGWDINSSAANGIEIKNTNAYFTILYVTVHSTTHSYKGIYLSNADNGSIEDASVTDNQYGIYVTGCVNTDIDSCSVTSASGNGIYILSSSDIDVTDCTASSNGNNGIHLSGCTVATISGGEMSSNSWRGIYVGAGNNTNISGTTTSSNGLDGIYLTSVSSISTKNVTISGVSSTDNSRYGLQMASCRYVSVTDSNFSLNDNSGYAGIYAAWLSNPSITISYNDFYKNDYGVYLKSSTGISVCYNNFVDNYDNAYDNNDNDNAWDDGVDCGNYWDDYGGSGHYHIDADTVDNYPQTEMFT